MKEGVISFTDINQAREFLANLSENQSFSFYRDEQKNVRKIFERLKDNSILVSLSYIDATEDLTEVIVSLDDASSMIYQNGIPYQSNVSFYIED